MVLGSSPVAVQFNFGPLGQLCPHEDSALYNCQVSSPLLRKFSTSVFITKKNFWSFCFLPQILLYILLPWRWNQSQNLIQLSWIENLMCRFQLLYQRLHQEGPVVLWCRAWMLSKPKIAMFGGISGLLDDVSNNC